MGGLALKSTFTRRYMRDEYEVLEQEVFDILSNTFKRYDTPRFFESKESFGDMDVIISMEGFNQNMRKYIEETFKPNEIFHNGNAWSFDYKELQIDFITCAPEHYDSNYHYLAFNDLGNFIGRIAQKMGLKYGQEGLWYNHFYKDQKVGKIIISKDYPKIFKYLDLDYDQWIKGFDSLEEIFEYVMTSKYFSADQFQLDQLNKINRERNAKRKSYMSFLEYIDHLEPNEEGKRLMQEHKDNVIKRVSKVFPEANLKLEVAKIEYEAAKSTYVSQKFNGGMLIDKYGLEGQALGTAINDFRNVIEDVYGNYQDFIINNSIDKIYIEFEEATGY